jgi:septal ring factor EnvC (AmiA/AmiB activator)
VIGSTALVLLLGWAAVFGPSARANDLAGAFRQAQQLVDEFRHRQSSRPSGGRTVDDYATYSTQAQRATDEAAARLAEAVAVMATLDEASRAYLEQNTSAADRSSVAALMEAIRRLHADTQERHQALLTRLAELRREMAGLESELAALDSDAAELRATRESIAADLEQIRELAADVGARLAKLQAALAQARELGDSLERGRVARQTAYWEKCGDTFTRLGLGTPRDYVPEIVPDAPVTQRRVKHVSTGPVVVVPALAMPVAASSVTALAPAYAMPVAAAAAATGASPPEFTGAVDRWLGLARATYQAQSQADALFDAVQATRQNLGDRAAEIARLRSQTTGLQSALADAGRELNRNVGKLQSTHGELARTVEHGFRALGEGLFWAQAQDLLARALRGVSHHAELAAHFTWVVRSYTRLLRDDLPRAIELLGPNPSDEALAQFERLSNLTEIYVADRELSLVMAQVTSPREASVSRVEPLDLQANFRRQKANLQEFIQETKTLWSPRKNLSPLQNAFEHWRKHAAEFPEYEYNWQYFDGAKRFLAEPPPGTLVKVRDSGQRVLYHPESNRFSVQNPDGSPETFFRPDPAKHHYPTNLDYFHDQ